MKNKKKVFAQLFAAGIIFLLLVPSVAFSIELGEAKKQGLVGEMQNGYLGIVNSSRDRAVAELVKSTNALRKKEYERIARKNGTEVKVVEEIGGKKAINKTPAGYYVMVADGKWTMKE